jgi:DNA polymerase III subunit gamma/tau
MRDALSILDKIVSFTDGKLTYANTLEHLNILDEDYYFKLLEYLQGQDLASAMLLYDEINGKGFEGETVLNGLAEFFRNLLVCKDERTLNLLETVEGFRDKYAAAAKQTSLAWLISALQVLNEAEIQYKQARNKKLHIELVLIRLAYLQQALELTASGTDPVKKKLDTVKPVQFRAIASMRLASGAKLEVEEKSNPAFPHYAGQARGTGIESKESKVLEKTSEQVNRVSEPEKKVPGAAPHFPPSTPVPRNAGSDLPAPPAPRPTLGQLQKLRQKIGQQQGKSDEALPLTEEHLREAWSKYVDRLTEAKNHTAADNLRTAELVITSDKTFDIFTGTNIQLRFIEQERGGLIDHLQQFFHNRQITYQVLLRENTAEAEPAEKPLNKREQFQVMTEKYPLIRELRDRLNLSLD